MINRTNGFDLNIKWSFPEARKYAFAFISLFVFLLTIYGNSFDCGWHFDDGLNIVSNVNSHLRELSWQDIKKTFYFAGELSRPVARLSLALNYYFDGLNVAGYHAVNLCIHYITAMFLFLFIYNTLKLPIFKGRYETSSYAIALLATFLWATNPVQTLAVSYIVQRMSSMAGMFYIMAMYFYFRGRTSDHLGNSITFFVMALVSALLSLGSKENSAILPASLFLYDLLLIQGITKENIKKNIKIVLPPLMVLLALGVCFVDISTILDGYDDITFTLTERLLTEPRVIIFYITLLFYPINSRLALIHDIELSQSLFQPWTTIPAILIIVLVTGCALAAARKRPLISFCVIFFFLNHLIEGSIIPLDLIFEHRNYIPSMFFFVPVAILILSLLDFFSYKKSIQFAVALGITFILIAQGQAVWMRNETLQSDLTLWLDNVEKAPNLSITHTNLGKEYLSHGVLSNALKELNMASQLNRYFDPCGAAIVEHNIGEIHRVERRDKLALACYGRAHTIAPENPLPLFGRAKIKIRQGNTKAAYQDINAALQRDPGNAKLHAFSSFVLLKLDRLGEALQESQKALDLDPEMDIPNALIAEIFRKRGKNQMAIEYWKKVIAKNPRNISAHLALIEISSLTNDNNLCTQTIGRLMSSDDGKNLMDLLHKTAENTELLVYVPDKEKILTIIRDNLHQQIQDINPEHM